jgi:nucleoside-diphosphate-sugar epimerase
MVSRVTCEQASSLAVQTNLAGVQNVLDLSKRAGSRVVYFSTSEVYGPDMEIMSEEAIPRPNNRYGLTKLLSESLVKYEAEQYGLKAVILRPFMMYDENEDFGDHRSAMIRFAYNLALQRPIEVHTGSLRGWMHVSDAVRVITAAAACELDSCVTINIGNDDIRSIERLAAMLCDELGADPALINATPLPERMTCIKVPDLRRQNEILKVKPEVSLEMGVKLVAARIRGRISAGMIYGDKTNRDDNYNSLLPFENLARLDTGKKG